LIAKYAEKWRTNVSGGWQMPDWMKQYADLITDTLPGGVDETMNKYGVGSSDVIATDEGKALSVNAQVGLLIALRSRGLLKEVPPCSLEEGS
jgi:hypothetical protein